MELLNTQWNNADIDIQASFMPNRLWLAATIDVLLNQEKILATGGKLRFKGKYEEQFKRDGVKHMVRLEWGQFWLHTVPCTLYIDDQQILQGKVNIRNWQMNIVALIFYGIFLFILCHSLLILSIAVKIMLGI